jgi:hypothetical protein
MANPIKYNTSAETLALKKGNFYIGTGDVGKGPTSSTGYYNGITPPSGGFTIYLNKASDGPAIYTVSTEAQLTALTNTISVSTNLIKNNNGGNFADGTIAPFNYTGDGYYPSIANISNDKPYVGSTSTYALKLTYGANYGTSLGRIASDPSPFTMTAGVTYTFSFWYKRTNANLTDLYFQNQGGSGDMNGSFNASVTPTQTWQRCSWTFTNVTNKSYFLMGVTNATAGSEVLATELTLTEGSMPGGPGLTTSGNCLNWFSTQTDKMIFNRDYESIVTSGLTLNLDAGFSPSFATIPSNANSSTVTPWYDLSLSGNNGTLTNGPTYSSVNGGSIVFDGSDDYINLFALNSTSSLTIDFFFKNSSAGIKVITGMYNGGPDWWIGIWEDNKFRFSFGSPSKAEVNTPFTVNDGLIRHASCVYDKNSNTILLYINGTLQSTGSTPSTVTQPVGNLTIGKFGELDAYFWPGNIYNYKIYNRALSSTEVLQNYNALKGRYGI